MSKIIHQKTRTLTTRDNGRSADAISPNFIYGCLGGCMSTYCYVARFNSEKVYINENVGDILLSVDKWVQKQPWPKVPNQTDDTYYTIDVGCSTDMSLHAKHVPDMKFIMRWFTKHDKLKSTFATKYPSRILLHKDILENCNVEKNRIRVSLMPQKYSTILEPNTDSIETRIQSIKDLQKHMEVHINFSPVVYTNDWKQQYHDLFKRLQNEGIDLPCEVIMLTYNEKQAQKQEDPLVSGLLYRPTIQEEKDSQYAPGNLRYHLPLKQQMVEQFKAIHSQYFTSPIRYIF